MRRTILAFLLVMALGALAAGGSFVFEPLPSDGVLTGLSGTTAGWGFQLTYVPDAGVDIPSWIVLTDSSFTGSDRYGTYTDYLALNAYIFGPVPLFSMVAWDLSATAGLGQFAIDPLAPVGLIAGDILVNYSLFSEDPNINPDSFTGSGTFAAPAGVMATPEPASLLLLGGAMLPAAFAVWRRRRKA